MLCGFWWFIWEKQHYYFLSFVLSLNACHFSFKLSYELWVWVLRSFWNMQLSLSLTMWVHCQLLWRCLPVWAILIILSSYSSCCEAVFEELYDNVGSKLLGKKCSFTVLFFPLPEVEFWSPKGERSHPALASGWGGCMHVCVYIS